MGINGSSRALRHSSSVVQTDAAQDEEELRIGAALAYMREQGNLDGYPCGRNERTTLMTIGIRRGLVAWDRVRQCYALSALGQRHLEVYAPWLTSTLPTSTRDNSRGGRVGRLVIAGFAVIACLGLVVMVAAGSPRIRSYFAGSPTLVEANPAASASANGGRTQVPVAPRPERPGGDVISSASQQTPTAHADEPATLAFKPGATILRTSTNASATSDAGYTRKTFQPVHRKVRSHLRSKKHRSKRTS